MFGHASINFTLDIYSHAIYSMDVGLADTTVEAPGRAHLRSLSRNASSRGLQYGCSKSPLTAHWSYELHGVIYLQNIYFLRRARQDSNLRPAD
jgi:hypothetical protein